MHLDICMQAQVWIRMLIWSGMSFQSIEFNPNKGGVEEGG
jgi:hypothetical protein